MMKHVLFMFACAATLSACSPSIDAGQVFDNLPKPSASKGVSLGMNNSKEFQAKKAVLMASASGLNQYDMVIFGEDTLAPCFGFGDNLIVAPLVKSPIVGRTVFSMTNSSWMVQFHDGKANPARLRYEGGGWIEILAFDGAKGTAKIEVGQVGSSDHAQGEFVFESCLGSGQ